MECSNDGKFVRFDLYCKTCKYADRIEDSEPCNECLTNPVNTDSQKPVLWVEK